MLMYGKLQLRLYIKKKKKKKAFRRKNKTKIVPLFQSSLL